MSVGFREFDEEKERERLRKMSDEELIREGKAARFFTLPIRISGNRPATRSWSGYDCYERSKP